MAAFRTPLILPWRTFSIRLCGSLIGIHAAVQGEYALTDKTIHNHEKNLELIGLIERRVGANGSRCRRKGLGLYLTPAMNMIEEMLCAL